MTVSLQHKRTVLDSKRWPGYTDGKKKTTGLPSGDVLSLVREREKDRQSQVYGPEESPNSTEQNAG